MEYEVWHIDTDECVGTVDIPQHVDEVSGARVTVKVRGVIEHKRLGQFNAIEMLVCKMKPRGREPYYALETNLPIPLLKKLEGFTPKIIMPRLADLVALFPGLRNRH